MNSKVPSYDLCLPSYKPFLQSLYRLIAISKVLLFMPRSELKQTYILVTRTWLESWSKNVDNIAW